MKHTFPLLKQQIKLLPYELKEDSRASQNTGFAFEIKGKINQARLTSALEQLGLEQDAIRTSLTLSESGEIVHSLRDGAGRWLRHDMRGYPRDIRLKQALREIRKLNRVPMDLFEEPMLAFHMYILAENDIVIYIKTSHLLIDGPSLRVIYAALVKAATGEEGRTSEKGQVPLSWESFVKEEQEYEVSAKGAEEKAYWEAYRKEMPPAVCEEEVLAAVSMSEKAPYGNSRAGEERTAGAGGWISTLSGSKLRTAAKEAKTSVFNVVLFLFAYSLGQIFDKEEISVNYTVSNRFKEAARHTLGLTTHSVPHTVRGLKWRANSEVFAESKAEFERNLGRHIMADHFCNSPFTLSYLSETVKIPEPEGYEIITHPIPGIGNQNDSSLILMCAEQGDRLEISTVSDRRVYSSAFFARLFLRMAEELNRLVLHPEEYAAGSAEKPAGVSSPFERAEATRSAETPEAEKEAGVSDGRIPLTYTQKDYIDIIYRRSEAAINLGGGVVLKGKYDLGRLERAVRKLYARYDGLRMVFHIKKSSNDAYLTLDNSISRGVEVVEAEGSDRDSRYAFALRDAHERMDVPSLYNKDSMSRFWVYVTDEEEIVVCFLINHMISDATSVSILQTTLLMLYQDPDRTDLPAPGSFAEFLKRRTSLHWSRAGKESAKYWAHRMDAYHSPEIPKLDEDAQEGAATFRPLVFSAEKIRKISQVCKTSNFNVFYMLWQLALAELCGQTDIALRFVYAGRNTTADQQMIGMLVHGITERSDFRMGVHWRSLMNEHKKLVDEDMKHVDTADIVHVDDFVMSYLLKDTSFAKPAFESFDVSETFPLSLSKTYDVGNYLIAMGVETGEHILLIPYGNSAIYSKTVLERLENLVAAYVEKLSDDIDIPLEKLCENPAFLEEKKNLQKLPLTLTQSYYLKKEFPDNPGSLNLGNALHIRGDLDLERLVKAIKLLYRRYDAFRMVLHTEESEYYLTTREDISPEIEILDAEGADRAEKLRFALADSREKVKIPIMLSPEGMARFWIYRLAEDELVLSYSINHIVNDGTSFALMEYALEKLYEDPDRSDLTEPGSYAEFLLERKALPDTEEGKKCREYWSSRMDGYRDPVIEKPPQGVEKRTSMEYGKIEIPKRKIRKIAAKTKTSNFHVIYKLWQLSLAEVMRQNDIALRYAFSGRTTEKELNLFGLVAHGLTMRSAFRGSDTWGELIREHKKACDTDMKYVSLADLVPVREFVMSYVDNTGREIRTSFADAQLLGTFPLTSSYFKGRYLAAMVVEGPEEITLYPYCDNDVYGTALVMRLKTAMENYVNRIFEDTVSGKESSLAELCLDDSYLRGDEVTAAQVPEGLAWDGPEAFENSAPDGMDSTGASQNNNEEIEEALLALVKEYLDLDETPNGEDDFFEMGGNSFKAFCVMNNLPEKYQGGLFMSDFYEAESLNELAEILAGRIKEPA